MSAVKVLAACAMMMLGACSRSGGAADAGVESGSAAGPATESASARPEESGAREAPASLPESREGGAPRRSAAARAASAMEARRSSVVRAQAEPVLAANLELLRKQFGGVMPASIGLQTTELTDDKRRAVLLFSERKDGSPENPFVLVVDDKNAVVWSRERPTAGIKAPATAMAIANGPEGRFAMAVCDPPTSTVALRLWDEDGSPFADFSALESNACDALSLLYWPAHGWVIVAAGPTETRAQLVTESGGMSWGQGKVLGARWRTAAPATLAADSASSFLLVQYSQSPGVDRDADHALAFRYDDQGTALWPSPTDLGAVRRVVPGHERIGLVRTSDNVLRVTLAEAQVELRSNGEQRRIP